jgi:hypothetical protein
MTQTSLDFAKRQEAELTEPVTVDRMTELQLAAERAAHSRKGGVMAPQTSFRSYREPEVEYEVVELPRASDNFGGSVLGVNF